MQNHVACQILDLECRTGTVEQQRESDGGSVVEIGWTEHMSRSWAGVEPVVVCAFVYCHVKGHAPDSKGKKSKVYCYK